MSKLYEVLSELPPPLRDDAGEILDAILGSGQLVNWNHQLQLVVDGRSHPGTYIVDLVAHVLYPQDERIEEPKAFKIFVEALKDIKLEPEWVKNELVKDILDDSDDDSSDSQNEVANDSASDNEENAADNSNSESDDEEKE